MNVLIALIDPIHIGHEAAHRWFESARDAAWATCPITENAHRQPPQISELGRIAGGRPADPDGPAPPRWP